MGVELSAGATRINGTSPCYAARLRLYSMKSIANMLMALTFLIFFLTGLAVSRALGDHFMKENGLGLISEPYVCQPIELTDEDSMLIVASDGVRPPSLFGSHLLLLFIIIIVAAGTDAALVVWRVRVVVGRDAGRGGDADRGGHGFGRGHGVLPCAVRNLQFALRRQRHRGGGPFVRAIV